MIKYEPLCGDTIKNACEQAVKMALLKHDNVEFSFNKITLTATPDTDPEALAQSYYDECDSRHAAYLASPECKAAQEEQDRKERERNNALTAALVNGPKHMTLKDQDGWEKACALDCAAS
jgi:hypothetical protein